MHRRCICRNGRSRQASGDAPSWLAVAIVILDCCSRSILAAGFAGNHQRSTEGATHTCATCGRRYILERVTAPDYKFHNATADTSGRVVHLKWKEITH
jgi:hypothetical protein